MNARDVTRLLLESTGQEETLQAFNAGEINFDEATGAVLLGLHERVTLCEEALGIKPKEDTPTEPPSEPPTEPQ